MTAGLDILVRLTPNASRDDLTALECLSDERAYLPARVRAVPEKGKANAALLGLMSKQLGVPKSALSIARGATSRPKTVRIEADRDTCDRITRLLEERS